MFNNNTRTTEKCIACFPKIEQGLQPQCVTSCIGRIRLAGFISPPGQVNPQNPIDYLVKVKKMALPLYPQAGTEPNVYYIPPIHADHAYLRQMLGPGVDEAIKTYQNTKNDPELLGLMMLFGSAERIAIASASRAKMPLAWTRTAWSSCACPCAMAGRAPTSTSAAPTTTTSPSWPGHARWRAMTTDQAWTAGPRSRWRRGGRRLAAGIAIRRHRPGDRTAHGAARAPPIDNPNADLAVPITSWSL
jgi:hypothetical protein